MITLHCLRQEEILLQVLEILQQDLEDLRVQSHLVRPLHHQNPECPEVLYHLFLLFHHADLADQWSLEVQSDLQDQLHLVHLVYPEYLVDQPIPECPDRLYHPCLLECLAYLVALVLLVHQYLRYHLLDLEDQLLLEYHDLHEDLEFLAYLEYLHRP